MNIEFPITITDTGIGEDIPESAIQGFKPKWDRKINSYRPFTRQERRVAKRVTDDLDKLCMKLIDDAVVFVINNRGMDKEERDERLTAILEENETCWRRNIGMMCADKKRIVQLERSQWENLFMQRVQQSLKIIFEKK